MSLRASSGLGAWTLQRFSAIYMALFAIYVFFELMLGKEIGYGPWVAWVSYPFNNIALGLFVLSLLVHAWVGTRDIILDYVKPFYFRILKLSIVAFLLIAMGVWALGILVKVAGM